MPDAIVLDHLEIHVRDIPRYADFLTRLFRGGEARVLNSAGVSMYRTPEGRFFELKPRSTEAAPDRSGVCLPCIRMADPLPHLAHLGLEVHETATNERGSIHFFVDHEGIEWHAKDYPRPDPTVDW